MKEFNPDHVNAIAETVNTCPYFTLLSMKLLSLGKGESFLEIEIQEKHLQPYGVVHGGVCASLIDAAVYWAVYAGIDRIVGLTTVDLNLNYLAPVSKGRMRARGECIKAGKTICLGKASIEDNDGRLLAHGTSTLMVMEAMTIEGHDRLPPKFMPE